MWGLGLRIGLNLGRPFSLGHMGGGTLVTYPDPVPPATLIGTMKPSRRSHFSTSRWTMSRIVAVSCARGCVGAWVRGCAGARVSWCKATERG